MSAFELLDTAMDAALDLLVGEQCEPAFDLVEPGGAGRREVEVIARVAGEPRFDGWRFVGGVVVEHQMDVEIGRHGLLDLRQEFAEFDRPVALVAAADDPTGGDVQGGEQRGCAEPALISLSGSYSSTAVLLTWSTVITAGAVQPSSYWAQLLIAKRSIVRCSC